MTYRKSYIGFWKYPIYWTPKIQDGGDLPSWKSACRHFSTVGGPICIKFRILVQNDMPTAAIHCGSKKNAPTLADYNYDPVQSILIIFSKLFVNDHKSCSVVKFSISPHICCNYTLWNTVLYFALITLLIARNAPTSDHHITSISVKEF